MASPNPFSSPDPIQDSQDYFNQFKPTFEPDARTASGMSPVSKVYDSSGLYDPSSLELGPQPAMFQKSAFAGSGVGPAGGTASLTPDASQFPVSSLDMPNLPSISADPNAGGTSGTVSKVLGATSGALAWIPAVGTALSGLSAVGSMIASWWSAGKQIDAQKAAQATAQKDYEQQMAESTRRYNIEAEQKSKTFKEAQAEFQTQAGLAQQQETYTEKMGAATLKLQEQQQYYDRWLMLMSNATKMMSSPASRAGFAQLYS